MTMKYIYIMSVCMYVCLHIYMCMYIDDFHMMLYKVAFFPYTIVCHELRFHMFEVVHQAVAYGSLLNDSEKQAGAIVETREEGYL